MVWSIEGDGSTGPPSAHIFSFQLWRSSSSASRIRDDTECIPLRRPRGSLQRRGVNQPLAQLDFIEESSGLREKSDLPEPTSGRRAMFAFVGAIDCDLRHSLIQPGIAERQGFYESA
ncbi:hypothetical protein A6X20_01710 [Bradyrhizobium elkanii]|nr:hypothetical protein A6452_17000 [Bradyrhizobium elkanii]ODM86376.1 hypothetical protein A6X20_01710 [Bradyrhizobium elkanii]